MPRVHYVKKARKANKEAGVKKGDSYYWWKFAFGPKCYSKTPPRRSQLTRSSFLSSLYDLQDEIGSADALTADEVLTLRDDWVSRIQDMRDECESSRENMPQQLQESGSGELLQERIDALEMWITDLDSIDCNWEESMMEGYDPDSPPSDEEKQEAEEKWAAETLQQIKDTDCGL